MVLAPLTMVKAAVAGLLLVLLAVSAPFLITQQGPPATGPAEVSLLPALLQTDADGFAAADAPWQFSFPADHAAHPDFRTESWHFSGTMSTLQGRRFGFQLTLLRLGVTPPAAALGPSAWAARDVYWGQFAVTDAADNRVHAFERVARAAMGLSGSAPSPPRVWLGEWMVELPDGGGEEALFDVRAAQGDVGIELSLRGAKPAVIPAAGGAGQGGGSPVTTFHAYLLTRLLARGTIRIEGRVFDVEGHAWLDRAWGMVPVPVGAVVWDRFSLQLDDSRELMALQLRRRDGSGRPVVTAMLVERDGSMRPLPERSVSIGVVDWVIADDDLRLPARWQLRIAGEQSELYLVPYVAAQERQRSLWSWAGPVRISGIVDGRATEGNGYVELAADDRCCGARRGVRAGD